MSKLSKEAFRFILDWLLTIIDEVLVLLDDKPVLKLVVLSVLLIGAASAAFILNY